MKRKCLFVIGILFFIVFSSVVFAYDGIIKQGPYIAGRLGLCFLDDATLSERGFPYTIEAEFDTGVVFEGAVGYDFGMYRLEAEIGYRKNDVDTFSDFGGTVVGGGDVDTLSFMVNYYFDFENHTFLTPYFVTGIGFAEVSANDISVANYPVGSEDDTVFAYQFGVGVGYSVLESLIIDVGYKYFATSDPEFDFIEAEYSSHNVFFGIRCFF